MQPGGRGWKLARGLGGIAGLGVVALGLWLLLPSENFGVVAPGAAYRSAQPTTHLNRLLARYKPSTIMNLRGGSSGDWWYTAEVEATQRAAITFYDLPLSATRRPSRRELRVLTDTLRTCPLPVLIHCKSGADRTGLVSALFLLVRQGLPPDRALQEFSIRYGHIPLGGPERLHEPLVEYRDWLGANGLNHSPSQFRDWVARFYQAPDPHAEQPVLNPGPRLRASRDPNL